jgi:hypothetical protein
MVSLTFNEIEYEFKFNYNTHQLHILKNGNKVSSLDYNPIIVHNLSLKRCVDILIENNLIK